MEDLLKPGPNTRRRIVFALLIGIAILPGGAAARPVDADAGIADGPTAQETLEDMLLSRAAMSAQSPLQIQILSFYSARDFTPAWSGSEAAETMGAAVREKLQFAYDQGLRPADYVSKLAHWPAPPEGGAEAALYDLAVSEALFRYAADLRTGRVYPSDVYKDVRLPARDFDIAALLTTALNRADIDAFFANLPPPHPEYQSLVDALARYRAIAAQGGWPVVSGNGPFAFDGNDLRAKLLARRLAFEDSALATNLEPSGDDVREALIRYQFRNGLEVDGKPNEKTLQALNVPPAIRVRQIIANMERWRWLPRAFERRHIRINVPDQSLDLIENGAVVLHSRVIIGKKVTPTPILRTEVLAVVANPPWDIPDDIAARQLLPHLRQNSNYLTVRNMTLVDGPASDPQGAGIDWRQVKSSRLPYQIRQPAGPDNVLGQYMLDSPNDFDVYMHDTPNKKLFTQNMREASNGCVRVEQIASLAALLLDEDGVEHSAALDLALASGETHSLALIHPLPAYMLYWTAIADPDGTVSFRPDRYNRDPALLAKLVGPEPTPRAQQRLSSLAK
jgi:murein L,D-transpeptidase YcbB/YkuD